MPTIKDKLNQNIDYLLMLKYPVALGAICYLLIGIYSYIFGTTPDLLHRWQEAGYVISGFDPIQVAHHGGPIIERYGQLFPLYGYPPWSYFYAQFLAPPLFSFPLAKLVFLFINILSIVALIVILRRISFIISVENEWLMIVVSVLCCSSIAVALRLGQYGVLVSVLLWLFLYFESLNFNFLAGLSFALAMIKPQIAALFFLLLLARRSFRTMAWSILFLGIATAIVSYQCQTTPLKMLSEMVDTGTSNWFYMGLADPLKQYISYKALFFLSSSLFGLVTLFLVIMFRHDSLYELAAVPAVFSTLWMSHRAHDLLIISFLLVPILALSIKHPRNDYILLAIATGFSHWLPHFQRFYYDYPMPILYRSFWLFVLFYMILLPSYYRRNISSRI